MSNDLTILAITPSAIDSLIVCIPLGEDEQKPLQDISFIEIKIR